MKASIVFAAVFLAGCANQGPTGDVEVLGGLAKVNYMSDFALTDERCRAFAASGDLRGAFQCQQGANDQREENRRTVGLQREQEAANAYHRGRYSHRYDPEGGSLNDVVSLHDCDTEANYYYRMECRRGQEEAMAYDIPWERRQYQRLKAKGAYNAGRDAIPAYDP